ncbi:disulfide bond formation protein DsbB [Sulfurifustis variabilis]|uniref:Disulfide bond formation protein B n=1 Tax=Sulfurifustis variabilis TaxID=1675686 RepID=A0A1B4V5J9_9GAMM|nr:disulfide bond formation protein B [Sulfurifustis variabilis]BAU47842.1 disulfide bond formation protein DsbB [Sulfurifustis variabilis]
MNRRHLFLAILFVCAGLLAGALYLQEVENLAPCPLCVGQRIAYWLVGLVALVGFIHTPPGRAAARLYSALIVAFAVVGAAVAIRQEWIIIHAKPGGCSMAISPEEKLLNALPLAQWWPSMFEAAGDCASVTWTFISLSIPEWSLIWFVILAGAGVYAGVAKSQK